MNNKKISKWRKNLEAMGFVFEGEEYCCRETKESCHVSIWLTGGVLRLNYTDFESDVVHIKGINTPVDVRKFLDAVGEL